MKRIFSLILFNIFFLTSCKKQQVNKKNFPFTANQNRLEAKTNETLQYDMILRLKPEQESCIATYPELKSENIRTGINIGGVLGIANFSYPPCSETLMVNCISSNDFPAVEIKELDSKVVLGQSIASINGTVSIEQHTDCSKSNESGCITTSTFRSMDLSRKDSDGALDLASTNFVTRVSSSNSFEYWDETGVRHVNFGDGDLASLNIESGVTVFATIGSANPPPNCNSISISGTWILVPGDPDYGTRDFCVMKYEAKNNANVPASEAAGSPWNSISQRDAITCGREDGHPSSPLLEPIVLL